jgi:hypothetical protein
MDVHLNKMTNRKIEKHTNGDEQTDTYGQPNTRKNERLLRDTNIWADSRIKPVYQVLELK